MEPPENPFVSIEGNEVVHDTGQGTSSALSGLPDDLSADSTSSLQNVPEDVIVPDASKTQPNSPGGKGDSCPSSPGDSHMDLCCESGESAKFVRECLASSNEAGEKFASKPKIVVESEDKEIREVGSSLDEDLDPLIAFDDSESQTSDLINFDTVSYDVIPPHVGDEEEDDERSLATVSSLSCDLRLDSPLKLSLQSNSSSLINLLDVSVKDSDVAASPSVQMLVDRDVSGASSCPSSISSITMSSAVDESVSESIGHILQCFGDVKGTDNNQCSSQTIIPIGEFHQTNDDSSGGKCRGTQQEIGSTVSDYGDHSGPVKQNSHGAETLMHLSEVIPTKELHNFQDKGSSTEKIPIEDVGLSSEAALLQVPYLSACDLYSECSVSDNSSGSERTVILSPEMIGSVQNENTSLSCLYDKSGLLVQSDECTDNSGELKCSDELHSVESPESAESLRAPCRNIESHDDDLIEPVILYNNSDNCLKESSHSEDDGNVPYSSPKNYPGDSRSPLDNSSIVLKKTSESTKAKNVIDLSSFIVFTSDTKPHEETPSASSCPSNSLTLDLQVTEDVSDDTLPGVPSTSDTAFSKEGCDDVALNSSPAVPSSSGIEAIAVEGRVTVENFSEDSVPQSTLSVEKGSNHTELTCVPGILSSNTTAPSARLETFSGNISTMLPSMIPEFLGLLNPVSSPGPLKAKQHTASVLDEAQQAASSLVNDILQKAVAKAEDILHGSKTDVSNRIEVVEAAQVLVDEVINAASSKVSSTCSTAADLIVGDLTQSETLSLTDPSGTSEIEEHDSMHSSSGFVTKSSLESSTCQVTSDCVKGEDTPTTSSVDEKESSHISDSFDLQQSALGVEEASCNILPIEPLLIVTPKQLASGFERIQKPGTGCVEEQCSTFNIDSNSNNIKDRNSSEVANSSEENSTSDKGVDSHLSAETERTPTPEYCPSDSARSSLLTCSDIGLRSEASLFIDGVLEDAVKKYEESSSSESSPVKMKSLCLDSEYQEEELTTPCGEMLTEHFMDFESGRNVSVFCSLSDNNSEGHLLAYDRVAHTIDNTEVDSDTGKSVSVFRSEEDVFYEIQRASTCTSVFESVEEEDEDMVDTTLPLEDRPGRTMKTSISLPSFDDDKLEIFNDPFKAGNDAFDDAAGAFLTKRRVASEAAATAEGKKNPCRALVLKHPAYDISNEQEKKRMAEKWANGGESQVPDTPEMQEKQRAIREALDSDEDVAIKLCRLALTEGGLMNDALRREAWPRMLGLDPSLEIDAPPLEDLKSHPEYGQVVLDVNRSLKRFPPDIPKDQRETLQDKLTHLIMTVISKHPHLRYYQGYHDVAVTFLLVVGESVAFQIMERLSTEHLSDCMQPTFERTSYLLNFIYPLLHRLHPTLAEYLERSEVGTMFCLPWFLTWFGHSLDRYQDVVRLYDHFLASPPLAPLYVAAVLVAHRADEVLAVDCDMAAIHSLLSHIPESLPLEILLRDATDLYVKFPPESIEKEVEERFRNEQLLREREVEVREKMQRQRLRRRRGRSHGSGSWQLAQLRDRVGGSMMALNRWVPPWVVQQQRLSVHLLFASATFFVGFYVYSRGGDMLPY